MSEALPPAVAAVLGLWKSNPTCIPHLAPCLDLGIPRGIFRTDDPDLSSAGAAECGLSIHTAEDTRLDLALGSLQGLWTRRKLDPSTLRRLSCCVISGEEVINYYLPSRALCEKLKKKKNWHNAMTVYWFLLH